MTTRFTLSSLTVFLLSATAFCLTSAFSAADEPTDPNAPSAPSVGSEPTAPSATEDEVDPRALAALDLYSKDDVEGAYRLFKEIYDANQDSDPPGVLLALLYSQSGKFLEMRRALEQTAEDYPTDPEAFLQLAGVDVQEGRFLEADLLIERAERLTDDYAARAPESSTRAPYLRKEICNARANLAERRGRYEAAKVCVEKSIALDPSDPQTRWNLGYLSMKLRDYDGAEAAFDEAKKLNDELWPGWLQVATSLDKADEIDEAKARLAKRGDELANEPKPLRSQLARLYMRWNMIDESMAIVKSFEEENDPNDAERWLLVGWLALYASEYANAEEAFRNATLIDASSFEASNGYALALLDQGDKDKIARAKGIAARNYRAYPDSTEAAATYAWTLFLSGSPKEADAIFQPILDSGALSATIAYYLAEIANFRGDKSLSRNLLNLALSQKSNFPKRAAARDLLAILDAEEGRLVVSPEEEEESGASEESADDWNDDEE